MTDTLARPSRRTLVRSAAWTVPVVSLAAMAPAFAASVASSKLTSTRQPNKWGVGNEKHVSWDLTLTNGTIDITSVSIVFSYAPTSGAGNFTLFEIYSYQPVSGPRDTTWSGGGASAGTAMVTSTHGAILADSTTLIHTDFSGADNAAGTVTATYTISYANGYTAPAATLGPVTWGVDNAVDKHTHPA